VDTGEPGDPNIRCTAAITSHSIRSIESIGSALIDAATTPSISIEQPNINSKSHAIEIWFFLRHFTRIPSTASNKNKRSSRASWANLLWNAMFQVVLWPGVQQFISSGHFWTSACRSVGPVRPSRPNYCFPTFPQRKSRARFDRLEKLGRLTSLGDIKPDDLRIWCVMQEPFNGFTRCVL
jgi:hypothetical protein